jgi:hypothetical protein
MISRSVREAGVSETIRTIGEQERKRSRRSRKIRRKKGEARNRKNVNFRSL